MSGIYLIVVVLLWSWLTWHMFRFGWRLTNQTTEMRRARIALVAGLMVTWLAVSFWYAGGRIYYYDWQVRQMCAVDGGSKIYEVVTLPAEKFDHFGVVKAKISVSGEYIVADVYVLIDEEKLIRKENPRIWRNQLGVYSQKSMKLIGESTSYSRSGGDFIGPWHPSSFGCPPDSGNAFLLPRLFVISK